MAKDEKFLKTYLCVKCGKESYISDFDGPKCYYCEDGFLLEIKNEKQTHRSLDEAILKLNSELAKILREQYINKDFDEEYGSEEEIIEALKKIQEKNEKIRTWNTIESSFENPKILEGDGGIDGCREEEVKSLCKLFGKQDVVWKFVSRKFVDDEKKIDCVRVLILEIMEEREVFFDISRFVKE